MRKKFQENSILANYMKWDFFQCINELVNFFCSNEAKVKEWSWNTFPYLLHIYLQMVLVVLFNQLLAIPATMLMWNSIKQLTREEMRVVPDVYTTLGQVFVSMLAHDCIFYHGHRWWNAINGLYSTFSSSGLNLKLIIICPLSLS